MPFRTQPHVKPIGDGRWRINGQLEYASRAGETYTVPAGFETDFASVPKVLRWFLSIFAPSWRYKSTYPSVLHDYLYRMGRVSRETADDLFSEALESEEMAAPGRGLMWSGVRLGGWLSWGRHRKNEAKG